MGFYYTPFQTAWLGARGLVHGLSLCPAELGWQVHLASFCLVCPVLLTQKPAGQYWETNGIACNVRATTSGCLYEKLYLAPFRAFLCREPFRCAELSGLYDAIANGLWGAGLQNKIDAMENEKAELISVLESAAPATANLHPALAALNKEKIANLRMF